MTTNHANVAAASRDSVFRRTVRFARRIDRHILKLLFGFDSWHLSRLAERPYALDIIDFLNAQPEPGRQSVVEVGCGLGDILRHLRFKHRLGLDRDPRVLAAARVLAVPQRRADLRFAVFDFPRSELRGTFDAIVMVNWIHHIEPARLRERIRNYMADHLQSGGVLIIDTVQDPGYDYNHDVRDLTPDGVSVQHLGRYARQRDVWVLRNRSSH